MPHHYVPPVSVNVNSPIPKKLCGRARRSPMDSENITFKTLKQIAAQRLASGIGPSSASASNLTSALGAFMAERGFSDDDPVGSTLRASYRRHTTEHIAQLKREGRAASYISNRKSLLAHWRRVLIDSLHSKSPSASCSIRALR